MVTQRRCSEPPRQHPLTKLVVPQTSLVLKTHRPMVEVEQRTFSEQKQAAAMAPQDFSEPIQHHLQMPLATHSLAKAQQGPAAVETVLQVCSVLNRLRPAVLQDYLEHHHRQSLAVAVLAARRMFLATRLQRPAEEPRVCLESSRQRPAEATQDFWERGPLRPAVARRGSSAVGRQLPMAVGLQRFSGPSRQPLAEELQVCLVQSHPMVVAQPGSSAQILLSGRRRHHHLPPRT